LKAIVVGVIFTAIFAGVVAFFRIPYLQVEKIEISGIAGRVQKDKKNIS